MYSMYSVEIKTLRSQGVKGEVKPLPASKTPLLLYSLDIKKLYGAKESKEIYNNE